MRQINACHQLEQLSGEMSAGAVTRRAESDLTGFCLGHRDQILQRLRRKIRSGEQHDLLRGDVRDRREITYRIVGQVTRQANVGGHRRYRGHDQRIAVGRGACGEFTGNYATRARAIVDYYLLAPAFTESCADGAGEHVDATTGCAGHDDADRFAWISLGCAKRRR